MLSAEERVERLEMAPSANKRRMLMIVNPYATTVSDRLKHLVVYALQSRYEVEAVDTRERNHATDICKRAVDDNYDVVVAFGGDGTANEVANGLVGSDIPISFLPGGLTNVICRTVGMPNDIVDATEHLLNLADDFEPHKIDVGFANGRAFLFAAGAGFDADVVKSAEARPAAKQRIGASFYATMAVGKFAKDYLLRKPILRVESGDFSAEGVAAIVQNASAFTYWGSRELRVCEEVAIDSGSLSLIVLDRANPIDVIPVAARLLTERFSVTGNRHIKALEAFTEATVTATREKLLPLHVDGDHIGDFERIELSMRPRALNVIS